MPSLRDIARHANTSVTTVSLVLNGRDGPVRISEVTRRQVLEAANALGYTANMAARRLRSANGARAPLTIGVLLPLDERLTITVRALGTIRRQVDVWAQREGRTTPDLLVETYRGGHLDEVRSLTTDPRYNGAILYNTLPADDRWLAQTGPLTVPIVLVQRSVDGHNWVNIDNRHMGGEVAAHLLRLGHRRLGIITSSLAVAAQTERLEGLTEHLRHAAGVTIPEEAIARGPFSETGGYETTRDFLRTLAARGASIPTALFVTADLMAFGALHAVKEFGLRVPDDIALVGYDDEPMASYTDPPLTTVNASIQRAAEMATEIVVTVIHNRNTAPVTKYLEASLVVRGSCGGGRVLPPDKTDGMSGLP